MCHIEQRTSRITLHTHVLRLCQADQGTQRSRASNLGLVLLMRGQVRYTADRITLHLDIGRHHLADQRGQPSEGDDQDLILSYAVSAVGTGHEASRMHTIYSQIAKRGAGGALDFDIRALKQEEDGL